MIVLNQISNYFFLFNAFVSLIFIRFPNIFQFPLLRFGIYLLFLFGLILGVMTSYKIYKKLVLSLLIFIIAIAIHAFSNFYQPSLRFEISIQNYVLQPNITSDFAIAQTRLYMIFLVCFIFPAITFFNSIYNNESKNLRKYFLTSFLICFILNAFTSIYQGLFDIHFLSKGSLSAIDAKRAPGLLDDSGVASFFFAILSSTFFVLLFEYNNKLKYKIILVSLLFLSIISGIINNSRSYYFGFIATILIFLLYKIIKNAAQKKYKHLFSMSLFTIFFFYLLNLLSKYYEIIPFIKLKNAFNAIISNGDIFQKYALFDTQRSAHLKIMWETIKENFFTGTGLGSFPSNFYYQVNKLNLKNISSDIPTNTYFSLVSELGFAGLILIIFSSYLIIYYFINYNKLNINKKELNSTNILKMIPIWAGISYFILGLVSYLFYMPSLAYIGSCILATYLILFMRQNKTNEIYVSIIFCFMSAYLFSVSIYLAITTPIVPLFQYEKTGKFQVPAPIGTLPQPEGHHDEDKVYFSALLHGKNVFFRPKDSLEGQWFKPSTQFILTGSNYRIYIGPENRIYPVNVIITFYNQNGFSNQKNYIITNASWVYFSIPELKEFNSCSKNVTIYSLCYYQIHVKPAWEASFITNVGFYFEYKYINGPNAWR
jgi:hypothetical protein